MMFFDPFHFSSSTQQQAAKSTFTKKNSLKFLLGSVLEQTDKIVVNVRSPPFFLYSFGLTVLMTFWWWQQQLHHWSSVVHCRQLLRVLHYHHESWSLLWLFNLYLQMFTLFVVFFNSLLTIINNSSTFLLFSGENDVMRANKQPTKKQLREKNFTRVRKKEEKKKKLSINK